jgi:hypothetical protein
MSSYSRSVLLIINFISSLKMSVVGTGGGGGRETTIFHITAALCMSATDRSDDTSPNKSLSNSRHVIPSLFNTNYVL